MTTTNPNLQAPERCSACMLRTQAFYAAVPGNEMDEFSTLNRRTIVVAPRRIILHEGEIPETVYTVFDGWAFRFKRLPDGRRQILSYLLPSDFIGIQSLLGRPVHYAIMALTTVKLCAFDRRAMTEFVATRPPLKANLTATLLRKAEVLDYRLIELGRCSAQERVARFILQIEGRLRQLGLAGGDEWPLPLRQEHIADTLGLTVVHVSRTVATLRQAGLMTLGNGMVTIHDRARLLELAGPLLPAAPMDNGASLVPT